MLIEAGVIYNHYPDGKRPTHPRDVPEYLEKSEVQYWIKYYMSKKEDQG